MQVGIVVEAENRLMIYIHYMWKLSCALLGMLFQYLYFISLLTSWEMHKCPISSCPKELDVGIS